jgi:hypothetical protein
VKTLTTTLALGLLVGSTALVQAANAVTPISKARMKALQECTVLEDKYAQYTWGVQQLDLYRACMAQHGQQE